MKPWRLPSAQTRVPMKKKLERDDEGGRRSHQAVGDDAVVEGVAGGAEDGERRHVGPEHGEQEDGGG